MLMDGLTDHAAGRRAAAVSRLRLYRPEGGIAPIRTTSLSSMTLRREIDNNVGACVRRRIAAASARLRSGLPPVRRAATPTASRRLSSVTSARSSGRSTAMSGARGIYSTTIPWRGCGHRRREATNRESSPPQNFIGTFRRDLRAVADLATRRRPQRSRRATCFGFLPASACRTPDGEAAGRAADRRLRPQPALVSLAADYCRHRRCRACQFRLRRYPCRAGSPRAGGPRRRGLRRGHRHPSARAPDGGGDDPRGRAGAVDARRPAVDRHRPVERVPDPRFGHRQVFDCETPARHRRRTGGTAVTSRITALARDRPCQNEATEAAEERRRWAMRFSARAGRADLPDLGDHLRLQSALRSLPVVFGQAPAQRTDHRRSQTADRRMGGHAGVLHQRRRRRADEPARLLRADGLRARAWRRGQVQHQRHPDRRRRRRLDRRARDYLDVQISIDGASAGHQRPGARRRARTTAPVAPWSVSPRRAFRFKINATVTRHNLCRTRSSLRSGAFITAPNCGSRACARPAAASTSGTGLRPTHAQNRVLYDWLLAHRDVLTGDSFFHLVRLWRAGRGAEHVRRGPHRLLRRPGRRGVCLPVPSRAGILRRQCPSAGRVRGVWRNAPLFAHGRDWEVGGRCQSCHAYGQCHGGCIAVKHFTGRSLDAPDPTACSRHSGRVRMTA